MSLFEDASLIITPNGVKAGKLFALKCAHLDVVRATTKTRVNSLGVIESVPMNVAALDYTDSTCPSILVEPQRTNLVLRSEEFNDAYWIKLNSTITANVITSPSGTTTADLLIANTSNSLHRINFSNFNVNVTGVRITVSIYVKKGGYNFFYFRENIDNGTVVETYFDLENGILGNIGANRIAQIINVGNDWYRCIISSTTTNTNINVGVGFGVANSNGVSSFTGNDVSGIYIWGAQLEAGANATSYIPTVASAVTRNQDVISKTGISDLIGQTEGTVFVEFFYKNNFTELLNIQNTTSSFLMRTRIGQVGTNILSTIYANGGSFPLHPNYTLTPNSINKICIVYNYANKTTKLFANGVFVGSTVGTNAYPTTSQDRIGLGNFAGDSTESRFNIVNVFKTQLTDAECIALTTP